MKSSMKLVTLLIICVLIPILATERNLQDSNQSQNTTPSGNYTNSTNSTDYQNQTRPILPKEPNTTFVDEIVIPFYRSSLTPQQRSDYDYWIRYKNSFNAAEGQLAKLTKYFAPEDMEYYINVFKSGWPFYSLAALSFVFFIAYVILRCCCKKFMGPKAHITIWFGVWTWFLFVLGIALAGTFYGLSLARTTEIRQNVLSFVGYSNDQSLSLQSKIDELAGNVTLLKDLNYTTQATTFVTDIYDFNGIKNETIDYMNITLELNKKLDIVETGNYGFQIFLFVFVGLMAFLAYLFYFLKTTRGILAVSILLFLLTIPVLVIIGLHTSYFLLSIDFCQNIQQSVVSGIVPTARRGVGYFISCPSKKTSISISTSLYELGNSFNHLIENVNQTLISKYSDDIGPFKRDNAKFDEYYNKYSANDTNLANGIIALKYTNQIIYNLLALGECQVASNIINYTEDHYCYPSIGSIYYVIIFFILGTIGLVLLTIGTNKLIVLLNPAYQNMKKGVKLLE